MREKFDNHNPTHLPLGAGYYGEWVWNTSHLDVEQADAARRRLERAPPARATASAIQYQTDSPLPRLLDHSDGTAAARGRLRAAIVDALGRAAALHRRRALGPSLHRRRGRASRRRPPHRWRWPQGTRVQLGFGQYVQYPEITLLTSPLGSRGLLPMRSNHAARRRRAASGPAHPPPRRILRSRRSRPALPAALRSAPAQRQAGRSAAPIRCT